MPHYQIRILLWWLTAIFIICSAWVIEHFVVNGGLTVTNTSNSTEVGTTDITQLASKPRVDRQKFSESDFIYVWGKRLRRPLEDLPPPKAAPPTPAVVAPPVKVPEIAVAGTLIEDDLQARRAWLILPGNMRKLVTVGEILENVAGKPVVTGIEDRRVTLKLGDNEFIKELSADVSKPFESL